MTHDEAKELWILDPDTLYLFDGWYGPNHTPVDISKGDAPVPVGGKKVPPKPRDKC